MNKKRTKMNKKYKEDKWYKNEYLFYYIEIRTNSLKKEIINQ